MSKRTTKARPPAAGLPKAPTGISGLDEVTGGGLPRGRPTLVCGAAGCGKTLLAMEFLVRGATDFDEPGVFFAFEETTRELADNVRSLGFDLDELAAENKLKLEFVRVERSEIEEAGEYDLEGLFVRLGHAIDTVKARRVVLDTIETLFGGLSNHAILRAELRRLFRWLKDRGVTAVITAERGGGPLTRFGLEEYVSDCVILLDHRVTEEVSTRRLRVVKYRGSVHGTNEYPFLIDEDGITVLPVTSAGLQYEAGDERVSSGVAGLDAMLGGEGYFRGSTVMVTGTAGSGKTSVAAHFVRAACERREKCVYFAFEESQGQIIRNMRSIGVDFAPWVDRGLLRFRSIRSTHYGLEMHLATIQKLVREFQPRVVVLDPLDSLTQAGSRRDAAMTLVRLIDHFKAQGITALLTNLTSGGGAAESSGLDVSSLVDTWVLLRDLEYGGERNRVVYLLKSRGMAHSNQLREFLITDRGISLRETYTGPAGVLTGSARLAQEAREAADDLLRRQEVEARERALERRREALDARIDALRKEFDAEAEDLRRGIGQAKGREAMLERDRRAMAESRKAEDGRSWGGEGNGDRP
jgi:circadian clock protein KaiC